MRTVEELKYYELDELRDTLYWKLVDEGVMVDEITNDMLFEHFSGIGFVEEDFFCNLKD